MKSVCSLIKLTDKHNGNARLVTGRVKEDLDSKLLGRSSELRCYMKIGGGEKKFSSSPKV